MNTAAAGGGTTEDQAIAVSSVEVASLPWAFTQQHVLGTEQVISEAKRRSFVLDVSTLRELYRHGLLVPFVYTSNRQVGPIPPPIETEPHPNSSRLIDLRHARDRGRLVDLAAIPFRPRLNFIRPDDVAARGWWNGLLYSRYELLVLAEIGGWLAQGKHSGRHGRRVVRFPRPGHVLQVRAQRLRTIAVVLTALEARYLPKLDPEWIHLNNGEVHEWERYRDAFDPVAMSAQLGYSADRARKDAEDLLFRAHSLDPVGDDWSRLMRRAPQKSWERLEDDALLAVDHRIAAEILLLFYEDIAAQGKAEPLPDLPRRGGWHPLYERLSFRSGTLDEDLMGLGISPHPRVVLAIEGETEQVHVPYVRRALAYSEAPELLRLLWLGGVDKDLQKVAALAAAPLVGEKLPGSDAWTLIKPPTRLFIAVDPVGKFFAPNKVARTRRAILNEIKAVLKAQGVTAADPAELEELVVIRTWSASCYEFAHFSDEELADGIRAVHHTSNGLTRDDLVAAIKTERDRGKDIKEVWSQWDHKPGKPELADALWPALEAKIDRCRTDSEAPVPEIVEVVQEAHLVAQRWRYRSFALSEELATPSSQSGNAAAGTSSGD